MFIFNVVKEPNGWAVSMGDSMKTPFRSRSLAIQEAHSLADAIRGHGQLARVTIEFADCEQPGGTIEVVGCHKPATWQGRRVGVR